MTKKTCTWCQMVASLPIAKGVPIAPSVGTFLKRTPTGEMTMELCQQHAKAPSVLRPA
jgi:hypothetical protein